jgi:hypothetical protein
MNQGERARRAERGSSVSKSAKAARICGRVRRWKKRARAATPISAASMVRRAAFRRTGVDDDVAPEAPRGYCFCRLTLGRRLVYGRGSMLQKAQRGHLRDELKKVVRSLVVAGAFVIAYVVALALKRRISASPIIYYEGIGVILALGAAAVTVLLALDLFRSESKRFKSDALLGILLGMTVAYAFHITLPSLVDRSISMFVLSLLREKPLTPPEVQCNYVQQFVIAKGALDKRVKEQIATGNILAQDGKLHMTSRGEKMDASWISLADAFSVRKDFVEVRPVATCDGSTDGKPAGEGDTPSPWGLRPQTPR